MNHSPPLPGRVAGFGLILGAAMLFAGCSSGASPQYASIDDLPQCDPKAPSGECLKQLFLPLKDTQWPFDGARVAAAYTAGEFQVLSGWDLTALHVLDGRVSLAGKVPNCYAEAFEYAASGSTIERPNCGSLLFLGGHPRSVACGKEGITLLDCVDQVPVAETFDIGLVAANPTAARLEVRADVQVGEEVFAVGNPGFLLSGADQSTVNYLHDHYPLVSSGKVLQVDGRGIVISNLAFPGNSGGPLLDRQGRVVGVVYTRIRDLREQGTPTNEALADSRTVAVRIESQVKTFIDAKAASE
ncbi:MAG: serine protease [Polyangiaceae bacterium]